MGWDDTSIVLSQTITNSLRIDSVFMKPRCISSSSSGSLESIAQMCVQDIAVLATRCNMRPSTTWQVVGLSVVRNLMRRFRIARLELPTCLATCSLDITTPTTAAITTPPATTSPTPTPTPPTPTTTTTTTTTTTIPYMCVLVVFFQNEVVCRLPFSDIDLGYPLLRRRKKQTFVCRIVLLRHESVLCSERMLPFCKPEMRIHVFCEVYEVSQ